MSALATAARTNAAPQAAPPVMRRADRQSRYAPPPIASLAAIPAGPSIQRKCAACDKEEESAVQPRLEVGPVGDRYEREADGIAAQVMAMPDAAVAMAGDASAAGGAVQRACSACSSSREEPRARRFPLTSKEEEVVRARRNGGSETIAASDSDLTSGGAALPAATRSFFEDRMGRDLGDVRIHQGGDARAKNDTIGARAFTYKNHVWLGAGENAAPGFTMAHELAHVMQQTAPGPIGPQRRPLGAASSITVSQEPVQRKPRLAPFFMPGDQWDSMALHTQRHGIAQKVIARANPSIATEVPIPGASADKKEIGRCGFADLYTATIGPGASAPTVPGIELVAGEVPSPKDPSVKIPAIGTFTKSAKSPATCLKTPQWGKAQFKGAKLETDVSAAPRYEGGQVVDVPKAPTGIKLGEIKPAHNVEYRGDGAKQLRNYIDSLEEIRKVTNQHAYKAGGPSPQWHGTPTAFRTLTFPKSWDDDGNPTSGWPVKDLKIRDPQTKRFIDVLGPLVPKTKLNPSPRKFDPTGINGRWMLAEDSTRVKKGDGVFVYYLAPNPADISKALKDYKTAADFSKIAKQVLAVYKALKTPPKVAKVRKLPRATPVSPTVTPRRAVVQREAKDHFERARWDAMRTGNAAYPDESKSNLTDLLVQHAPSELRQKIEGYGTIADWVRTMPEKSQGINYGTAAGPAKAPAQDYQTLRRAIFWSSKWAAPFGVLREKFGWLFVKGFEKFEAAKKAIHKKFAEKKQGSYLGKHKGTIRKAAAQVAAIVIPKVLAPFLRTMFNTIVDCAVEGFQAKFASLIEGTPIDDLIQMGAELEEKVKTIVDDAEKYFAKLVDDSIAGVKKKIDSFVGDLKLLTGIAGGIAEIAKGMRIASCIGGLIAAPETVGIGAVVGCGFALADYILSWFGLSPLEYIVALTIKSCESQNVIGRLVAGMSFMQELPKLAASKVVNTTKKLLKDNLTEIVMEKPLGVHAAEMFCDIDKKLFPPTVFEEFRCGASGAGNDETSDAIPRSSTGGYDIPESETPPYVRQDSIPDKEKPWMGTDDPPGRAKAPAPTRGHTKGTPGAGAAGAGAVGSGTPSGAGGTAGAGSAGTTTYRDTIKEPPADATTSQYYVYFYTGQDVSNITDGQKVSGRVAYVGSSKQFVSGVREFLAYRHPTPGRLIIAATENFAIERHENSGGKSQLVSTLFVTKGDRDVVIVNPAGGQ
ncbi:MAG TPA: DUF4157 domain-containing protein [Allosphingosinicella sp.]|jgi:hypothetical protein